MLAYFGVAKALQGAGLLGRPHPSQNVGVF